MGRGMHSGVWHIVRDVTRCQQQQRKDRARCHVPELLARQTCPTAASIPNRPVDVVATNDRLYSVGAHLEG